MRKHNMKRFTDEEIKDISDLRKNGASYKHICEKYQCGVSKIARALMIGSTNQKKQTPIRIQLSSEPETEVSSGNAVLVYIKISDLKDLIRGGLL